METRRDFIKSASIGAAGIAAGAAVSASNIARDAVVSGTASASEASQTPEGYVEGYYSQIDWLGEKPEVSESDITDSLDFDVVVIGSGHSGSQVALAAVEEGLSVAVVESQTEEDFTENGSEVGHFNSKYLQEHYGVPQSNIGDVVDEFVKAGNGQVKPSIIRKYVANSGEMFDHFVEIIQQSQYSFILDDDAAFLHVNINEDGTQNYTNYPIVESGSRSWAGTVMFKIAPGAEDPSGGRRHNGLYMLKAVIEHAQELGVRYFWGHRGYVLDQNENGDVTGVIAKTPDDTFIRLNASKGVAVCCGDFSTNPQMTASLLPELLEWNLRNGMTFEEATESLMGMGRDGYGHRMCCWAGGRIEEAPRATQQAGTAGTQERDIPAGPFGAASFLELNCKGERFFNESDYYSARGATARQPKGTIAFVTDTQYLKSVAHSGIYHGGPNFGRKSFYDNIVASFDEAGKTPGEHEVAVASISFAGKTTIYSANTIEELAGYLGYEGDAVTTFVESVNRYNEMCEQGYDDDFGKDPACLIPVDKPPYFGWTGYNQG
ncbi:MAG: FAD-dependent oxidoreductase, partial [Coriobacteriales bacterium]